MREFQSSGQERRTADPARSPEARKKIGIRKVTNALLMVAQTGEARSSCISRRPAWKSATSRMAIALAASTQSARAAVIVVPSPQTCSAPYRVDVSGSCRRAATGGGSVVIPVPRFVGHPPNVHERFAPSPLDVVDP